MSADPVDEYCLYPLRYRSEMILKNRYNRRLGQAKNLTKIYLLVIIFGIFVRIEWIVFFFTIYNVRWAISIIAIID